MKKFISLICSVALLAAFSHTVMADLSVQDQGSIDSSVIFDTVPTPEPEKEDTSESTSPNRGSSSSGGGIFMGGTQTSGNTASDGAVIVETEEKDDAPVATQAPDNPFSDVLAEDWFYDDVMYVYENNIMSGVGSDMFSPKTGITRAMMITILYRVADKPQTNGAAFADVDPAAWYADAVSWGAQNKIVNGTGENRFSPDADITREQLAVMLYNYRKMSTDEDPKADISAYSDHTDVSAWAQEAMSWAVGNGVINGKSDTMLAPADGATRAEAAAIIRRYITL